MCISGRQRKSMVLSAQKCLKVFTVFFPSVLGFHPTTRLLPSTLQRQTNLPLRVHAEALLSEYDGMFESDTFRNRYKNTLPDWILTKAEECGYYHPTCIQQRVLDSVLEDNETDLVVHAQTGSGKTLAFLLPILANVDPTRSAVQAIIVVPTRELGLQVSKVAKRLAKPRNIMIMSVLQGSQNRRQRAWAWAEPPPLIIGTPDELTNMIKLGGIKRYNAIKYLVVDEVDACLLNNDDNVFASSSPLHELLSKYLSPTYDEKSDDQFEERKRPLSQQRTTIFCSATIPQHRHFLKQCVSNQWMLKQPKFISISSFLPQQLSHAYVVCHNKPAALKRLLKRIQASDNSAKTLVFCDHQRDLLEFQLPGDFVLRLKDNLDERAHNLDQFRETDQFAVLWTTDLAARGLDIQNLTHVIHWDLPKTSDTYVHRSGRTGRMGNSGKVISLISPEQEFVIERWGNELQIEIQCIGKQKN